MKPTTGVPAPAITYSDPPADPGRPSNRTDADAGTGAPSEAVTPDAVPRYTMSAAVVDEFVTTT